MRRVSKKENTTWAAPWKIQGIHSAHRDIRARRSSEKLQFLGSEEAHNITQGQWEPDQEVRYPHTHWGTEFYSVGLSFQTLQHRKFVFRKCRHSKPWIHGKQIWVNWMVNSEPLSPAGLLHQRLIRATSVTPGSTAGNPLLLAMGSKLRVQESPVIPLKLFWSQ